MARRPVISRTPKPAAAQRRVPVVTIDEAVDAAAGYPRASRSPATWRVRGRRESLSDLVLSR